ncbi:hypothetical protein [Paraburkholderia humisilvae]|uniref:Uncharacterized protein n=1 Tax=Paraburkholderia humisilvae TaxID=627669 RepID=A0A6J5F493_9BURK|nr:hypothetical protein [Paraburkholderia humisilvae]CAB3773244.1 hypothetical protein LMG29542_07155 [Paraburkholderia humisilvae]
MSRLKRSPGKLLDWLSRKPARLFFVTSVAIPNMVTVPYYGFVAAGKYISESHFVVRSQRQVAAPVTDPMPGLSARQEQDDASIVCDYMRSMDALTGLEASLHLRKQFGAPYGDTVSRFPAWGGTDSSDGHLLRYYRDHVVDVTRDSTTGITTLRTSAFNARMAQQINERLLAMSEVLLNRLNQQARQDEIRYASALVQRARHRLEASTRALSEYRMNHGVFDPQRQSLLLMHQIGRLQEAWLGTQGRLAEVQSESPHSAQVERLNTRMDVLGAQIEGISRRMTGKDGASLAEQGREFEELEIDRAFAERQLGSALALQAQAETRAAIERLYLVRIVQPGLPDAPQKPRRFCSIFAIFGISMAIWGLLSLLAFRKRPRISH